MLRSIQRGWVGWAIVVALVSAPGCGKEHEGGERSAGVQRAGKGAGAAREAQGPPKRIFAKRFVVNVRSGPSREAPRVGYLRGGAVLRATTAEPVGHEGCRGGWFELTTGGYVCNGRDVIAFDGKRLPEVRSTQPDLSAKMPYQYGLIRKDHTPIYRRLPNEEEAAQYEGYVPPGQKKKQAQPKPEAVASAGDAGPVAVAVTAAHVGAKAEAAAGATDPGSGEQDGGVVDAGPPTLDSLQPSDEESDVLQRWVMRGFYVSLDKTFDVGRRRYWRTQQNGFVPYKSVMLVDGSDFRGAVLDGDEWALPIGFILSRHTPRYVAREDGRVRLDRKKPGYHYMFRIVGEREQRGRKYYEGQDGFLYRADQVVRIDARDRPADVKDIKWVDVDLSQQTLVAYEGDRPVFATLISSGRVRNENVDELNHATPTGTFRFTSKHLTHTMDGDNAIDGPYSIDDVPYVMYFQLAFATHSAFWHDRFGRPKSHGCVNMSPFDAKWLFNWADPPLPKGWHGVYPTKNGRHTTIIVRGETPKG